VAVRTKTELIIIHCSATPPDMDIGAKEIDQWHRDRGWSMIAYHDVIRRNGALELGREENQVGAHAKGHNSVSVGICLVGGVDNDNNPQNNFTPAQFKTLRRSIRFYQILFPNASVIGHRDVNPNKACPSFDIGQWLKDEL